jgi:hypothetical protein
VDLVLVIRSSENADEDNGDRRYEVRDTAGVVPEEIKEMLPVAFAPHLDHRRIVARSSVRGPTKAARRCWSIENLSEGSGNVSAPVTATER